MNFKEAIADFNKIIKKKAYSKDALLSLEDKLSGETNLNERVKLEKLLVEICQQEIERALKEGDEATAAESKNALSYYMFDLYQDIAKRELHRNGIKKYTKLSPSYMTEFPVVFDFLVNDNDHRYNVQVSVDESGTPTLKKSEDLSFASDKERDLVERLALSDSEEERQTLMDEMADLDYNDARDTDPDEYGNHWTQIFNSKNDLFNKPSLNTDLYQGNELLIDEKSPDTVPGRPEEGFSLQEKYEELVSRYNKIDESDDDYKAEMAYEIVRLLTDNLDHFGDEELEQWTAIAEHHSRAYSDSLTNDYFDSNEADVTQLGAWKEKNPAAVDYRRMVKEFEDIDADDTQHKYEKAMAIWEFCNENTDNRSIGEDKLNFWTSETEKWQVRLQEEWQSNLSPLTPEGEEMEKMVLTFNQLDRETDAKEMAVLSKKIVSLLEDSLDKGIEDEFINQEDLKFWKEEHQEYSQRYQRSLFGKKANRTDYADLEELKKTYLDHKNQLVGNITSRKHNDNVAHSAANFYRLSARKALKEYMEDKGIIGRERLIEMPYDYNVFPLEFTYMLPEETVIISVNEDGDASILPSSIATDSEIAAIAASLQELSKQAQLMFADDFEDEEEPIMPDSEQAIRSSLRALTLLERAFESFHPENELESDFNREKVNDIIEELDALGKDLSFKDEKTDISSFIQRVENLRTGLKYSWEDLEPSISRVQVEGLFSELENNLFTLRDQGLGEMSEPDAMEAPHQEELFHPDEDVFTSGPSSARWDEANI